MLIELRNILEQDGFQTVAGGAFRERAFLFQNLAAGKPDAKDLASSSKSQKSKS
ncbi:MAG: hypothetical protein V8Q32_08590 [Anaerotignum faecicola]